MKYFTHMKNASMALCGLFMLAVMPIAPNAIAQQEIGDVIDEIFKTGQFPKPGQERQDQRGRIDNIPVAVRFDTKQSGHGRALPDESMLIVTAYAPSPPNVRRSSPLMIGQTHLLMAGLGSPAQIIIAAPSSITQELDHARIEAKIVDMNGATLYELPFPGKYQGYEAPVLNLVYVGSTQTDGSISSGNTYPNTPTVPHDLSSETISGKVRLNGRAPKFSGSNLVVRLIEDGLAGGTSRMIAGETRQILDGKTAPFDFSFERVIDPKRPDTPLALEVWIEDWAGRKTHVTPSPIPYNGPKTKYRIKLDAIGENPNYRLPECTPENPCTNMPTLPLPIPRQNPIVQPSPRTTPVPTYSKINGEAQFNAGKGLPKGAVLIAALERQNGASKPTILASTRLSLDGLSGNIGFKLTVNTANLDANLSTPMLRVRIESRDGTLFFSNPGGTRLAPGFNAVALRKSSFY